MQTDKIFLISMEKDELRSWIQSAISEEFRKRKAKDDQSPDTEKLLTRKEVAKIYKTSYVTLRQWEKDGVIPKPIRKGTRVYFRKSDIMNDLLRKEEI